MTPGSGATAALTGAASPHTGAVVVTSTSPLWYTTRATGLIALVLITASVVLGLLTSVRFSLPTWPRFVTVGLHRNMSLLVLVFTGLHILTTVTDSYAHIHLVDVFVPLASSYRPVWLGLGAAAFDLLLAVSITSLLRVHVGHRVWRLVHWLAYLCWPAAVVHGLGTGTDTRAHWDLLVTAACVAAVTAAAAWRLAAGSRQRPGTRTALAAGVIVALVAGTAWVADGPLKAGWARRAGTPAGLLAGSARTAGGAASPGGQSVTGGGSGATAAALPAPPFTASVLGRLSQTANSAAGTVAVRIHATVSPTAGGNRAVLDIVIDGTADGSGGVTMSSSRVTFGTLAAATAYTGQLVGLDGTAMTALVRDHAGHRLLLDVGLQPNGDSVTGTLQARAAGRGEGGGE